jgi:hypothetical protein
MADGLAQPLGLSATSNIGTVFAHFKKDSTVPIIGTSVQSNIGTVFAHFKKDSTVPILGTSVQSNIGFPRVYNLRDASYLYIIPASNYTQFNYVNDEMFIGVISSHGTLYTPTPTNRIGFFIDDLQDALPKYFGPNSYNESTNSETPYEVVTQASNREVNFGVITADKTIILAIENNRLDNIILTSHTVPTEFGCVISGVDIGQVIPPNTTVYLIITAKLMVGLEEIAAWCPIYFDKVTINVFVNITRQPTVVYSMFPDRDSYKESYTFKTNIFESTSGRETRQTTLSTPKVAIDYSITTTNVRETGFVLNNLYTGIGSIMYQPLWAFATTLTTEAINTNVLLCDTYTGVFSVDSYCGVYLDEFTVILMRIQNISIGSLELTKNTSAPAGAYVVPLIVGTPNTSAAYNYSVSTSSKIKMSLVEL